MAMASHLVKLCTIAPLIAIAALPAAAHAETRVMRSTSPWKMDYGANSCQLQRGFGTPEDPVLLQIQQFAPGNRIFVTVAGKAFDGIHDDFNVELSTGPETRDPISTIFTLGDMKTADGKALTTLIFAGTTLNGFTRKGVAPAPVTSEREQAITSFIVSWGDEAVQIGTGPLAKSMEAMRTCTDALVKSWGLDPEQQASLSQPAKSLTPPSSWFTSGNYPMDLAAAGRQALVEVRMMIDAAGALTDCKVIQGYNEPRFEKATCDQIVKRAHFKPALDKAGSPTASYHITRVRWMVDHKPRVIRRGNRQDGRANHW